MTKGQIETAAENWRQRSKKLMAFYMDDTKNEDRRIKALELYLTMTLRARYLELIIYKAEYGIGDSLPSGVISAGNRIRDIKKSL